MTTRDLVKRWRKLEPERASLVTLIPDDFTREGELDAHDKALLLAAVIEAVEASGRIFALDGGLDKPDRYVANVTRKGCGWLDGTNAGAETPAAALLGAYLAALEAQEGTNP